LTLQVRLSRSHTTGGFGSKVLHSGLTGHVTREGDVLSLPLLLHLADSLRRVHATSGSLITSLFHVDGFSGSGLVGTAIGQLIDDTGRIRALALK
jgi:hypothetical protein